MKRIKFSLEQSENLKNKKKLRRFRSFFIFIMPLPNQFFIFNTLWHQVAAKAFLFILFII